jgi:exonuclease III
MLILSLNIRGVGGASKLLSLKELLFSAKHDIVFLQETMVDHLRAKYFFLKVFPSWNCVATDSIGLSGVYYLGGTLVWVVLKLLVQIWGFFWKEGFQISLSQ